VLAFRFARQRFACPACRIYDYQKTGRPPQGSRRDRHSEERAHEYGQTSGFRIDVKRIAALPLTVDYFPDLEKPDHGKRGSSEHLANACEKLLFAIIKETPELVDFVGPEDSKTTVAKSF
jgi:hypothetical protein